MNQIDDDCISCEEDPEPDNPEDVDNYKCAKSERACGHHCNHVWSHDSCCWCGSTFGEDPTHPLLEEPETTISEIIETEHGKVWW